MPSLFVAGSIIFAALMIEADAALSDRWMSQWPRLFGVGAEGARQLLSTLAGSMMTVMGITFSMTLLALVQASSQYTSRILRNFMRSRVTQMTLGVFAGVFVYCLMVLRTIRGSGALDDFVPGLAVLFAFIMSLGGVGALVYFIHHIASSIQASSIIAAVAKETNTSIDQLLPNELNQSPDKEKALSQQLQALDARVWYPVPAAESGYIQSVDIAALVNLAQHNKTILRMEHGIGAFVVQNTALVSMALTYPPENETIVAINSAYSIGRHRPVEQDLAFGIRQIVDIAMKALSPGINDTSTAVMCVDYLSSILTRLAARQFPPAHQYEGETLRLLAIVPSFEGLLADAFDQIRGNAEANVAILARLITALETIGSLAIKQEHIHALDEQLQRIADLVGRSTEPVHDRVRLEGRLAQVVKQLKIRSALCTSEVRRTEHVQ